MEDRYALNSRGFPRCHVCRLPADVLDQLHHDRLQHWLTFEELAQKLQSCGKPLSDSSLRRHFRRHVPVGTYSQLPAGDSTPVVPSDVPTVFDNLPGGDKIDERAVLEATTRAIIGKMRAVEAEYQAAVGRHPQAAARALGTFLKTMGALERSLKSLQEARKPREEIRKLVGTLMVTLGRAAAGACREFMRDNTSKVREGVNEFLAGGVPVRYLTERLKWFEEDWPTRLKDTVTEAIKDALNESTELRGWL